MMYCDNYGATYPRDRFILKSIPDGVRVAPHTWKRALNPSVKSRDAWRCSTTGINRAGDPPPLNAHSPPIACFNHNEPLTVHPAFGRPLHGEVAGRSLVRIFTTRTDRSRNP